MERLIGGYIAVTICGSTAPESPVHHSSLELSVRKLPWAAVAVQTSERPDSLVKPAESKCQFPCGPRRETRGERVLC